MSKSLAVLSTAAFVFLVTSTLYKNTAYKATANGWISGCYDTWYQLYDKMGIKTDKESLLKFCEDKWDPGHSKGH